MKRYIIAVFALLLVFSFTVTAAEPPTRELADEKAYNDYLIKSLKDPNLGIRFSATKLIGERSVYEAKDDLVEMLKNDKEYQNRIAAGIALMNIGDAQVLSEIREQARKDKCKTVRHVLAGVTVEMENQRYLTVNK